MYLHYCTFIPLMQIETDILRAINMFTFSNQNIHTYLIYLRLRYILCQGIKLPWRVIRKSNNQDNHTGLF
jgi:hypothetical protein